MNKLFEILAGVLILMSTSCIQNHETEEYRFKSSIGTDKFEIVEHFMKAMEQKFMTNYQVTNINDAYNSYLANKFLGMSHLEFETRDCELYNSVIKTELVNDMVKLKYDEVYEKGDQVITVYESDTSFRVKPPEKSKGEYRDIIEEEGFYMEQIPNPLYKGLDDANRKDDLISAIIRANKFDGLINYESITTAVALEKPDFENQYLYRIIVCLEIYLNELKEYGC